MVATPRYYPKQVHANLLTALPDMVRFLIDDHPTLTGPGWSLVEAYDSNAGARETPSDPSDMDSLTGTLAWVTGGIQASDWVVLESSDGTNTNHFQLYIEAESATSVNLLVIPLEDFVTGSGGAISPPPFPLGSFGTASGSFVVLTGFTSSAFYTVVADEGMAMFSFDNMIGGINWTYVGEVDGARQNGTPPDDRAYLIWDSPTVMFFDMGTGTFNRRFNRLSPVDDSTHLDGTSNGGSHCHPRSQPDSQVYVHNGAERDFLLGVDSILPIGVYFGGTHKHFMGFLRNVYTVHRHLGAAGTLDNRNFAFRNSDSGGNPGVCFKWDGSTDFP